MDDIFKKIDDMFESEDVSKAILEELKAIKAILLAGRKEYKKDYKKTLNKAYYKFYYEFRERMRERPREGYYPEFEIEGRVYAIDKNGLMYDKKTKRHLPKHKAFEIYEKIFYEGYFVN